MLDREKLLEDFKIDKKNKKGELQILNSYKDNYYESEKKGEMR